jgi:hypothetical protein
MLTAGCCERSDVGIAARAIDEKTIPGKAREAERIIHQ